MFIIYIYWPWCSLSVIFLKGVSWTWSVKLEAHVYNSIHPRNSYCLRHYTIIIDEMNWPGNQILNHESSSDNKRLLLNYNSKQFLSCNDSITPSLLEKMFLWYLSNPGKHCNTLLMGWQARQVCKLLGTNKRQCIGVLRGEKTDMETKKTGILFIVT